MLADSHSFPVHDYLVRIGLADGRAPQRDSGVSGSGTCDSGTRSVSQIDVAALASAQFAAIPFENLDIHRGRPVEIDPDAIVEHLIVNRRGGICYQLNGLLWLALRALGVDASCIGARVCGADVMGPPLGHITVLAQIAGESWLLDVGFGGEMVCRPIDLTDQAQRRVEVGASAYLLEDHVRDLADFVAMAWWHSTSRRSRFTGSLICTRTVAGARITLTGADAPGSYRLVDTDGDDRAESVIDRAEAQRVLAESFGIEMDAIPLRAADFG